MQLEGAGAKPVGRKRIFYGWWVVLANAAITFYVAGTYFYGFGAFVNPLKQAFGWSTAQVSLAFSLRSAEAGPIAPLAGYLVDRFGARPSVVIGVCLMGLGFLLLSWMNSLLTFYLFYLVLALGASICAGVLPMTNISNWFIRKRGKALGVYTAGAGLSGLLVPIVTWLLVRYDWSTVLVMMAIGMLAVGLPLARVLRHRPEKYGMLPDGDEKPPEEDVPQNHQDIEGLSVRQALKERSFWLLTLTFLMSMAPLNAVAIFIIPYLTDAKEEHGLALAGAMAGAAVMIMTLTSLIGRFGFGWLADYYRPRYILTGLFVLQAAGLAILASVTSLWHLVPFFILFAPSYGGIIAVRPVILAQYFGRQALGMIQGVSMAMMTVGGVLTPLLVGFFRDTTGGYRWPFLVLELLMLVAIPLLLIARPPRGVPEVTVPARGTETFL